MPMPIDLMLETINGERIYVTIPLDIMLGAKQETAQDGSDFLVLPDWEWVHPYYYFKVPFSKEIIKTIIIDPSRRMADLDERNNIWPLPVEEAVPDH